MANPLVALGVLNRVKASINWSAFPSLNVTASFLGKAGITVNPQGGASAQLPAMTGVVQSPEPYIQVSILIHLLKTQGLSDAYKTQMELNALLGDCTVWPDVGGGGLSSFQFANVAIENVGNLDFSGGDAVYPVTCGGTWYINSALWD